MIMNLFVSIVPKCAWKEEERREFVSSDVAQE